MANSGPPPANDMPHTGGRIALLALAGALLIIFLTLFVVGIALGNRDASADAPPTLAPDFPSATALLTVAPQTPSPAATPTSKSGGGGGKGKSTATPLPTTPPTPTNTPILPTPTPTISSGGG